MFEVTGWHFVADSGLLRNGEVLEKKVYEVKEPLVMCKVGLHGSVRALDALNYAPGTMVCHVRSFGTGIHATDKYVSSHREVLAFADATNVLHEFACQCAERALRLGNIDDPQCWNAISVKRKWVSGLATLEELGAAGAAAWDAARIAARVTARDAARDAACDAAWDAAWVAAWVAARGAVRGAAWDAAWDAAWADMNTLLEKMLMELLYPEKA